MLQVCKQVFISESLVTRLSGQAPFTSEIVGLILAADSLHSFKKELVDALPKFVGFPGTLATGNVNRAAYDVVFDKFFHPRCAPSSDIGRMVR